MRNLLRWLRWTAVGAVALLLLAALWAWLALRASLPRVDGTVHVEGVLDAPVEITRDAAGVPTVTGRVMTDAACGLGFVHAQDRFFQMDLTRRLAAGELAALVGEPALAWDLRLRPYGYRGLAEAALAGLAEEHRRLLAAYTAGVNAGLADLGARPPEYLLLRARPEPWTQTDSMLVLYFFYHALSINHVLEKPLGVMKATLPGPLLEFLTPDTSRFDAPLLPGNPHDTHAAAPIPGPEIVDLRGRDAVRPDRDVVRPLGSTSIAGSNNWAVAGTRTAGGESILANDPHLALSVPNVWYRVALEWEGGGVRGVGPPGVPGIVIGTNGRLAWGVTNAVADQADWVVVETGPADPTEYLTPDGSEPFVRRTERIEIRGDEPFDLTVSTTRWGPVIDIDWRGRPLVLRSPALDPDGGDLGVLDLAGAATLEEGLAIARRWKGPSLNWVFAAAGGRIGWVLGGWLPKRVGFSGKTPASWAAGTRRWDGPLDETLRPAVVDPPDGLVFTANNRTVATGRSRLFGQGWMLPVRAARIRELLSDRDGLTEADLLAVQLDTRSPLHDMARDLVLEVTGTGEKDPALARARTHVAAWSGHADAGDAGFRILNAYYDLLLERLLSPLLAPAIEADDRFVYNWPLADEPARRLLERRPEHLLPPPHEDWPSFLRAVLEETVQRIEASGRGVDAPWGVVNRAAIQHPIARGAPALGWLLDMPADALSGGRSTVRVQVPTYGATMRLVVSPARPDAALFQMPTGQCGHFLSPHYDDGHAAWVRGEPGPLLPGRAVSSITLAP